MCVKSLASYWINIMSQFELSTSGSTVENYQFRSTLLLKWHSHFQRLDFLSTLVQTFIKL